MSTTNENRIPDGMKGLIPHLVCADASAAIDFYVRAFDAVELTRMPGPNGKLMHAMLMIGGSALMLVDEMPQYGVLSPTSLNGTPVTVHRYVDDVDAAIARAMEAGATVTMPAADMFWGDRYGVVQDPSGHKWSLATHLRDVSADEMQAAVAQM